MLIYRYILIHYKSILFALMIIVLSLYPFETSSKHGFFDFPHFDKVVHLLLYASFAFIIFTERPGRMNAKKYFFIVIFCLFLGGLIELVQISLPQRSGDIYDLIANFTGSLIAVPAHYVYKKIK